MRRTWVIAVLSISACSAERTSQSTLTKSDDKVVQDVFVTPTPETTDTGVSSLQDVLDAVRRDSAACNEDESKCRGRLATPFGEAEYAPSADETDETPPIPEQSVGVGPVYDTITLDDVLPYCQPTNLKEVLAFPMFEGAKDADLPVDCNVDINVQDDGTAILHKVSCTDVRFEESTRRSFENVRWTVGTPERPCEKNISYPFIYALD